PLQPGQADVQDENLFALEGDDQVGRLDVAVDQALFEGVLQSQGGLVDVIAGLVRRQRAGQFDQPHQVEPLDVLHDEVVDAAFEAEVEGLDEFGVLQLGDEGDFGLELVENLDVGLQLVVDDFEGDDLAELGVQGLEDLAQAALADQVEE